GIRDLIVTGVQTCALPICGSNKPGESQKMHLMDSGVGGAQIADVSVDTETGIVTVNEMVAVQDCGLIIDLKTAESQVYGALIMEIGRASCRESVYLAEDCT